MTGEGMRRDVGAVGDKMGRVHGIDKGRVDINGEHSPTLEEAPTGPSQQIFHPLLD